MTHNREYFFLSFSSSRRRRRFVLRRRPFHEQKLFSQLEVEWAKKFACAVEWAGSNNGRWPSRGQKRLRERAEKILFSFCVRCQDFLLCCLRPSWVTATRARADKRRGEGAANYCLWFIVGSKTKDFFALTTSSAAPSAPLWRSSFRDSYTSTKKLRRRRMCEVIHG